MRSVQLVSVLFVLFMLRAEVFAATGTVTFNKDVLPILQKNCQVCHRPGEIGPMSFLAYEETRPWAMAIKAAVLSRKMPPWFADPHVGHFSNERKLADAEIKTLVSWANGGAPEGDTKDKPAPKQWTDGWNIKPDVVYEMPRAVAIPEHGALEYIYILLPARFPKDTWIMDGEIQPGNRSAVHHASVIVRPPGSTWLKDAKVGEPYIPPKQGPVAMENSNAPQEWLLGYVPGMAPQRYFSPEKGAGRLIPAGSDIFFEIHYTGNGKKSEDKTRVGFVLAPEPPEKRLLNLVVYDTSFEIPPNTPNHPGSSWAVLNKPATLVYLQPHMHLRGTSMEIKVTYPDGRSEMLIRVPRYNFQWQVIYMLEKPLKLPKGTRIDVSATWDNSANNKFNPDPSSTVRSGQQSWDEMLVALFGMTVDKGVDAGQVLTMWWNVPR
jgi:hypothetical protein